MDKVQESAFKPLLKESEQSEAQVLEFFSERGSVGSDLDLMNLDLDSTSFYGFYGTSRSALVARCETILSLVESLEIRATHALGVFRLLAVNAISLEAIGQGESSPNMFLRKLIRETEVRQAIYQWYTPGESEADPKGDGRNSVAGPSQQDWGRLDLDSFELYRVGTTSLILSCNTVDRPHEQLALKLLLAPYVKVDIIAEATRLYARKFGSDPGDWVVPVYESSSRWILMKFVRGRTLREILDEAAAVKRGDSDEEVPGIRLDLFENYGTQVYSAVVNLAQSGRAHEDLTPSNILVEEVPGGSKRVVLIDLGRNYLFTRRLGSLSNRDTRFVAPEIRSDEAAGPANPDVFSLGMITAQLLDPSSQFDGVAPSSLYAYAPSIARLVEDMLDSDPRNRLILFDGYDLAVVQEALYEELSVLRSVAKSEKILGRRAPLLDLLLPSSRQVSTKFKEWKQSRKNSIATRQPRGYLFGWSVVSTANWTIVFTVCFLWGLRDFDLDNFNLYVTIAQKIFNSGDDLPFVDALRAPDYDIRDWQSNFTARIVGITTALAQTKYYQNIFSGIYVYSLRGGLAATAEVSLRFVTICTLVPVLIGNLVQPRWTLYLLAAGYVFIALNNLLFYLLLVRVFRRSREKFSTLPDEASVLQAFSQWWSTQIIYSAVVAAVALGLQLGVLRDLWAYIGLVCIVNVFVFYYSKCTVLAPAVRALLARAMTVGERVRLIDTRAATA